MRGIPIALLGAMLGVLGFYYIVLPCRPPAAWWLASSVSAGLLLAFLLLAP